MKILKKILVLVAVLVMTISVGTISNQSMAATNSTEGENSTTSETVENQQVKDAEIKKKAEEEKKKEKEERTKAINASKQKYPELTTGYGMKALNKSPIPSFTEGSNGKVNVTIKDGVGIDYIKVKNTSTKKEKTKTMKNKTTKQYTTTFTAPKTNKTKTMVYTVKDVSGLRSKVTCVIKNKENKYSFNVSMRVNFSYSDGKLNLILKDYAGINKDKASIELIDKNANNKSIVKVSAKDMKLKDTTEYNGKIIWGIYSVDIKKLTKDKDGKYKVQVKTTDCNGNTGYRMAKFIDEDTQAEIDKAKDKQNKAKADAEAEKEKAKKTTKNTTKNSTKKTSSGSNNQKPTSSESKKKKEGSSGSKKKKEESSGSSKKKDSKETKINNAEKQRSAGQKAVQQKRKTEAQTNSAEKQRSAGQKTVQQKRKTDAYYSRTGKKSSSSATSKKSTKTTTTQRTRGVQQ